MFWESISTIHIKEMCGRENSKREKSYPNDQYGFGIERHLPQHDRGTKDAELVLHQCNSIFII